MSKVKVMSHKNIVSGDFALSLWMLSSSSSHVNVSELFEEVDGSFFHIILKNNRFNIYNGYFYWWEFVLLIKRVIRNTFSNNNNNNNPICKAPECRKTSATL